MFQEKKLYKVIKIFSDFYYVSYNGILVECKLREVLKKSGFEPIVGDMVDIEEYNKNSNQAVITKIYPRINEIKRPNVSNIEQIIIVTTIKEPAVPLTQIDRYLAQAKIFNINAIICVNKSDLISDNEKEQIISIYRQLGYKIVFTSAKNSDIAELEKLLKNKTSIFSGMSGVGKTSLINAIIGENLKTNNVSEKNLRGRHTTRHTEIFEFENSYIVDTPGFSLLKFDYIEPKKVEQLFDDICCYAQGCKYSDCLHEKESECNVIKNSDKIFKSRLESYYAILQEAKNYKEKVKKQGKKFETKVKQVSDKNIPKISSQKRAHSRKKLKQALKKSTEI